MPIKVLLADDSNIVRRAIRRVLAVRPEIQLIGEATDFAQTIQMTNDLKPEVAGSGLKDSSHVSIER
jgi:chemotaxis response regulator CheB